MLHCLTMVMVKEWDGVQGGEDINMYMLTNLSGKRSLSEACASALSESYN